MKTTFDMMLFDDEQTRNKLPMLNTLEAMFDDERNILPPEYFYFSDDLPLGSRVRVTFELVNDSVPVLLGTHMSKELREAAQQALEALGLWATGRDMDAVALNDLIFRLEDALAEPTGKDSLQVPAEVAATITTTDIAWLETRRLTKLWQELGQMRWAGADEGWDRAIEAVRNRLDKECQDVLDWKAKADQSNVIAVELLQKMQGLKHD